MDCTDVLVFFLLHGTAVSLVLLGVFWLFAVVGVRLYRRTAFQRAVRRARTSRSPLEGDLASGGVRCGGLMVRFEGAATIVGPRPRIGDRVIVWGDVQIDDGTYRGVNRLIRRARLVARSPIFRVPTLVIAAPIALASWTLSWLAIEPVVRAEAIIAPAEPSRDALERVVSRKRAITPLVLALTSPFARARARRGVAAALARPSREDSPMTTDEARALAPLASTYSRRDIGDAARVRLTLDAARPREAVDAGLASDDEDARALAARIALTFGWLADAVKLGRPQGSTAVILAAMLGDFRAIADASTPDGCVSTWARVRLGDPGIPRLHDAWTRVRARSRDDTSSWFDDEWWVCMKLFDDVSPDEAREPMPFASPSQLWIVLRSYERGGSLFPPGEYELSNGASPDVVAATLGTAPSVDERVREAVLSQRDHYAERFVPPAECPSNIELRYAGDGLIARCMNEEPNEPAEVSAFDYPRWSSWWARMFTTRCIAPHIDQSSSQSSQGFNGYEEQCVDRLRDRSMKDGWRGWWQSMTSAFPCDRTWKQAPYVNLAARLVVAKSIARCAGLHELDATLGTSLETFRAALARRSTTALLWP